MKKICDVVTMSGSPIFHSTRTLVENEWIESVQRLATSAALLHQAVKGGAERSLIDRELERLSTDLRSYLELSLNEPALRDNETCDGAELLDELKRKLREAL